MSRSTGGRPVAAHIAAVAKVAGLDPYEFRCFLKGASDVSVTRNLLLAAGWVRMREDGLEQMIARDVRYANSLAGESRFLRYHTWRSIHSPEGFPDEVVIDRRYSIQYVWENKIEGGRPTPAQIEWLAAISDVAKHAPGAMICLGVVTPSRWSQEGRVRVLGLQPELPLMPLS